MSAATAAKASSWKEVRWVFRPQLLATGFGHSTQSSFVTVFRLCSARIWRGKRSWAEFESWSTFLCLLLLAKLPMQEESFESATGSWEYRLVHIEVFEIVPRNQRIRNKILLSRHLRAKPSRTRNCILRCLPGRSHTSRWICKEQVQTDSGDSLPLQVFHQKLKRAQCEPLHWLPGQPASSGLQDASSRWEKLVIFHQSSKTSPSTWS